MRQIKFTKMFCTGYLIEWEGALALFIFFLSSWSFKEKGDSRVRLTEIERYSKQVEVFLRLELRFIFDHVYYQDT